MTAFDFGYMSTSDFSKSLLCLKGIPIKAQGGMKCNPVKTEQQQTRGLKARYVPTVWGTCGV